METKFALRRNSVHAAFITRAFMGVAVGLALITFSLSLVTSFPFDLYWAAFLVIFPIVGSWGWRRYSIGTVELNKDDLVVRARAHTQTYLWTDVTGVTASTLGQAKSGPDRLILRIMGLDMSTPVAFLELKRYYRESVLWQRGGTRTLGIPIGKKIRIEPEDVDGFVEAANARLEVAAK